MLNSRRRRSTKWGHGPVQIDGGEQGRDERERSDQHCLELRTRARRCHEIVHGADVRRTCRNQPRRDGANIRNEASVRTVVRMTATTKAARYYVYAA
jgi:hypothetical protein